MNFNAVFHILTKRSEESGYSSYCNGKSSCLTAFPTLQVRILQDVDESSTTLDVQYLEVDGYNMETEADISIATSIPDVLYCDIIEEFSIYMYLARHL